MAKASFKYRGRTSEDVQRRAKQSSGRYDSYLTEEVTWFKSRPDENCIRLIPWLDQNDKDFKEYDEKWGNHWGIDIIVHRNVGPDNGTYLCLDKMKGEPCPICDAWHTDGIDDLKPSDRVLCWLIDRNNEKAGPQLWAMPLGVSKDISRVSEVKSTKELLLIDNWDEGYDVFFDREGEKNRTQYKRIALDRNPTPLADDIDRQNDWLAYVFNLRLPDVLKYYEADYLEKVLSGQKERPAEGEDDDRGNVRGSGRRRDSENGSGDREETASRGSRRGAEDADPAPRRGREADNVDGGRPSGRRAARDAGDGNREERTPSRRRGEPEETSERDREAESAQEELEAQQARTTRRRVVEDDPAADPLEPERDVTAARERLRNVGRGEGRRR